MQAGIFPLVSKDGLAEEAERLYDALRPDYDLFYLHRWSLHLDLWILWRTVIAVFRPSQRLEPADVPAGVCGAGLIAPAPAALATAQVIALDDADVALDPRLVAASGA